MQVEKEIGINFILQSVTSVVPKLVECSTVAKCMLRKPPAPTFSQKYVLFLANSSTSILYAKLPGAVVVSLDSASRNRY